MSYVVNCHRQNKNINLLETEEVADVLLMLLLEEDIFKRQTRLQSNIKMYSVKSDTVLHVWLEISMSSKTPRGQKRLVSCSAHVVEKSFAQVDRNSIRREFLPINFLPLNSRMFCRH